MDAGASITTFAIVGLQAVKIIHDIFSTIKDWPKDVAKVSNDVDVLRKVLSRISQPGLMIQPSLGELTKQCSADLQTYAQRLGRFAPSEAERRSGKLWRRLRAILDEKELRRMDAVVRKYVHQMTLELGVLQGDDIRETSRQVAALSSSQECFRTAYENNLQIQHTSTQSMQKEVSNLRQDTITANRSVQAAIATIGRDQEDFQTKAIGQLENQNSYMCSIKEDINTLQGAIKSMTTVSGPQQELMMAMFKQLSNQIASLQPGQSSEHDTSTFCQEVCGLSKSLSTKQDDINEAVDRLCGLLDEKPCTIASEDAQKIIEDIETLLDSVNQHLIQEDSLIASETSDDYGRCGREISRRDIKYIRGMLTSAPQLQLQHMSNIVRPPQGFDIKSSRKRRVFDLDAGNLTIATNKRRRISTSSDDTESTDLIVNVEFLTNGKTKRALFQATFYQNRTETGSFLSVPKLIINPTLPAGSLVFDVVRKGDIAKLRRMLQDGGASLRDHDEFGAPLLHYATAGHAVEMCRFLVDHGADVNAIADVQAVGAWDYEAYSRTALPVYGDLEDYEDERVIAHRSINRILLAAGADPTIPSSKSGVTAVYNSVWQGDPELLYILYGGDQHYTSVNTPDAEGQPPLHQFAVGQGSGYTLSGFAAFLRLGANIDATDPMGKTCLHIAAQSNRGTKSEADALLFLVQHGADLRALDGLGQSVSDYAYYFGWTHYGSASGDTWDSVLARAGHKVSEFRQGHPRRARFERWYNRKAFEQLWKGFEAECPYYDPWFDTHTYYACNEDEPSDPITIGFEDKSNKDYPSDEPDVYGDGTVAGGKEDLKKSNLSGNEIDWDQFETPYPVPSFASDWKGLAAEFDNPWVDEASHISTFTGSPIETWPGQGFDDGTDISMED